MHKLASLAGLLLSALAPSFMAGCASDGSGLITSLEDLTSETERQGASDFNQNRIISINGLLPHASVGSIFRYKKSRAPSTAIGITASPSFLLETTIGAQEKPATGQPSKGWTLAPIREKIVKARTAGAKAIADRLKVAALRSGLNEILGESPVDETRRSATEAELGSAMQAAETSRGAFDDALDAAVAAVSTPGVIVIRWQTNDREANSVALGGIVGAQSDKRTGTGGFAILGGLRLTSLFVGPDIAKAELKLTRAWDYGLSSLGGYIPWFGTHHYKNIRMTTHVLQAQEVMYLQDADIQEQAGAALDASYDQLANLEDTLKSLDRIEVDRITERLASLSNFGVTGAAKRAIYLPAFSQLTLERTGTEVDEERRTALLHAAKQLTGNVSLTRESLSTTQEQDGWITIYAVDADLESILEVFIQEAPAAKNPKPVEW